MKSLPIALSLGLLLLSAWNASAANPTNTPPTAPIMSQGTVAPTPEMWFYQQYQRQYQSPQEMVRRNADFEANQRMRRLAAMKWYGKSNSRPQAATDPYSTDYSGTWVSGNTYHPNQWTASGMPIVVIGRDRGY